MEQSSFKSQKILKDTLLYIFFSKNYWRNLHWNWNCKRRSTLPPAPYWRNLGFTSKAMLCKYPCLPHIFLISSNGLAGRAEPGNPLQPCKMSRQCWMTHTRILTFLHEPTVSRVLRSSLYLSYSYVDKKSESFWCFHNKLASNSYSTCLNVFWCLNFVVLISFPLSGWVDSQYCLRAIVTVLLRVITTATTSILMVRICRIIFLFNSHGTLLIRKLFFAHKGNPKKIK